MKWRRNKTWCPSKIVILLRLLVNSSGEETLILLFGSGQQTIDKDLQPMVRKSIKAH